MRPVYGGSVSIFFHVLPASVDLKSAVPFGAAGVFGTAAEPPPAPPNPPPLPCDVANIICGRSNAYSRSRVPFVFSGFRTFVHVLPPSVLRYTPWPLCRASPCVDASTRFGSFGSTTILCILTVSSRPICVHVLPASIDLYMPSPDEPPTESPVPA